MFFNISFSWVQWLVSFLSTKLQGFFQAWIDNLPFIIITNPIYINKPLNFIFIPILVKDIIILNTFKIFQNMMGLSQMCIFGHVHVFAKYPHWVSQIKTISEVNQLANNLAIQYQINIFMYSSFPNLAFSRRGVGTRLWSVI